MDMLTPKGTGVALEASGSEKLAQIARTLGCSSNSFFEQPNAGYPKDASLLIQTWLAIRSPKARHAVFTFAREMLRADKSQDNADCQKLRKIEIQNKYNK